MSLNILQSNQKYKSMTKEEISTKIQQNLYDINYWLSRNINPVDRDSIIGEAVGEVRILN